ncbi:hypothetical protein EDB85DRAFT_2298153 [Lactarius pseudohatsudake]|nr:hypothetical protein EDB85DRAFT_2298153 [Lactarius pseudohatsudake]
MPRMQRPTTPPQAEEQAQDRAGQETRTPPPPPLTRERGAAQEVARHPRLRAMGARLSLPASLVHARTGHANAGQAPAPATVAAAPVCAQRGRRYGQAMRPGTAWDKARAPPLPPLTGDRRPTPEAARPPPLVCAQRPYANEGSGRGENGRAPTPFASRPRFHTRAVRERERTGNVRTGTRRSGGPSPVHTTQGQANRGRAQPLGSASPAPALEPNPNGRPRGSTPPPLLSRVRAQGRNARAAARKRPPPPIPPVRAPGQNANGGRAYAPLSCGLARKGETRTGGRTETPPPLSPVRAPGQNATARPPGSTPLPVSALRGRAGWVVRDWAARKWGARCNPVLPHSALRTGAARTYVLPLLRRVTRFTKMRRRQAQPFVARVTSDFFSSIHHVPSAASEPAPSRSGHGKAKEQP